MTPDSTSPSPDPARRSHPDSFQPARDILENISDAFISLDRDWRITYVNPSYLRLVAPLYASAGELLGANLWEKFPDIVESEAGRFYRNAMASNKRGLLELFYEPLGTWLELRAFSVPSGLTIYIRNITDRKHHEQRLTELSRKVSEQAQLFDAILSNVTDLAYAFDHELRFLYANKPLLAALGRRLEEIAGKTCREIGYPPALADRLEHEMREVLTTGKPVKNETVFTDVAGRTDIHEYIYSPAFADDGSVSAMVGTTRLITGRKHAEIVAERQRHILQITAQGAPLARVLEEIVLGFEFEIHERAIASILLFDANSGRLRHGAAPNLPDAYNRAIDGLLIGPTVGTCGVAAALKKPVYTIDIEADPCWETGRELARAHGLRACWSTPIIAGDGELLGTFGVYFRETRGPTGDEIRILENTTRAASIAIERQLSEEALRASESQLRLVADHASVLLAHMDREHRYRFVNRPYASRYGFTPDKVAGRHAAEIVGQALYDRARPYIARALAGEEVEFELDVSHSPHDTRWSHVVYTPERNNAGEVVGFVAVHTDVTLRKKAELDATRARDEALKAGRAKDDFLAALSHELRTPLNPVLLLASEAAANPSLPSTVREDFSTIAKNVQLEARLIDDLLDLTRITRGKMSLDMQTVDVHTALKDAITTLRSELEARDLTLALDLQAAISTVRADPARLQQIFWNVLKNAVKFTPAGGEIKITTAVIPSAGKLRIDIADTGVGMTGTELAKVFDSFFQGDHSGRTGSHRFGGLGLGLSISRTLVELHAGTIEASSAGREQGATFTIHFPVVAAAPQELPASNSRSPHLPPSPGLRAAGPRRVLLVEDHEPTRKALAHLLTRRKFEVISAGSVTEALAAAAAHTIDFVISDIGLPDGNGHQLMATLRESHGLTGIALSGYGMDQDIAQGRAAGFLAHLIKPVDVQSLENALALIPRPADP